MDLGKEKKMRLEINALIKPPPSSQDTFYVLEGSDGTADSF